MNRLLAAMVGLACLIGAASAPADTLYRWVDDQGRLQLSDEPPPPGTPGVEQLAAPSYDTSTVPPDRYSILNQWRRMEASRQRLDERRLERERLQIERAMREREQAAQQAPMPGPAQSPIYIRPRPIHRPRYPHYGPVWPPTRPRSLWEPDHPAYRPHPPRPPPRPVQGRG